MSNKSSTATEPNKTGLPASAERGLGEPLASPAVAGVGIQGAPAPEVLEAEQGKGKAKKADGAPAPKAGIAWFRVKGPGSVKINGSWFPAGAELQIARAEALGVDEYLEEISSPS